MYKYLYEVLIKVTYASRFLWVYRISESWVLLQLKLSMLCNIFSLIAMIFISVLMNAKQMYL